MQVIIDYLLSMAAFAAIMFPPLLIWRIQQHRSIRKANPRHEIALMAFALFLAGLASQTVLPSSHTAGWDGINLIPFHIIEETYIVVSRTGDPTYFIINFLGNIILFMPIGFMLPLLWKIKGGMVLLAGAACSLFIELCQLFLPRSTDIDDLLLNTLGTLLGWGLYSLFNLKFRNTFKKFKV